MAHWNDFLWPLLMLNSPEKLTITVGVQWMAQTMFSVRWHLLMAGTCVSIIPVVVVYVLAQRYFVQGITLTGMKT